VTVTDQNGCIATTPISIPLIPPQLVSVNLSSVSLLQGDSIQLIASGAGNYQWSPAVGLSCAVCSDPLASPLQTTVYTVTATDANGCRSQASVTVEVDIRCNELFVPSIFSPNNAGPQRNEEVCVFSNCIAEMDFAIYDRWGQLVFQTQDPAECWDGTKNGKAFMTGQYAYRLRVQQIDGTQVNKSGYITLVK
jgi:gliding motility-associated-like protein